MRTLLAAVCLTASLTSQATWIVDRANGTGTHFTDLPPAVAAATAGDTIIVRKGWYFSSTTTTKPLTILGETGVRISSIHISNLPAGSTFTMKDIDVYVYAPSVLKISDCKGRVHLERVSAQLGGNPPYSGEGCTIVNSNFVTINGGEFYGRPGMTILGSIVMVTGSTIAGASQCGAVRCQTLTATAALYTRNSAVQLTQSIITGGDGATPFFTPQPGQVAILADNSLLFIMGDANSSIRAGTMNGTPPLAAIVTRFGGEVLRDPRVQILGAQGGPSFSGPAPVTTRQLATIEATGVAPGGQIQLTITASGGHAVVAGIGIPSDPQLTPYGTLALDINTFIPFATTVLGASGVLQRTIAVPNTPSLRGRTIAFQAADGNLRTGFVQLTNGLVVVLH